MWFRDRTPRCVRTSLGPHCCRGPLRPGTAPRVFVFGEGSLHAPRYCSTNHLSDGRWHFPGAGQAPHTPGGHHRDGSTGPALAMMLTPGSSPAPVTLGPAHRHDAPAPASASLWRGLRWRLRWVEGSQISPMH